MVDVGNSSIKTTEVVNGEFINTKIWEDISQVENFYKEAALMISSVRNLPSSILKRENAMVLSSMTPMPITLDYSTPETLGADRIAAAVGAMALFPNRDNLIIDVGTCMTIDLIDQSAVFRGGIISPGLKMRMKSMSHFTDKLPDISSEIQDFNSTTLGKSTKECLYSGSFWGMVHEINGVIRTMSQDFTSLNTILTGGDAHFFESNLKAHIFAGSKIVQKGLYRIWKHQ